MLEVKCEMQWSARNTTESQRRELKERRTRKWRRSRAYLGASNVFEREQELYGGIHYRLTMHYWNTDLGFCDTAHVFTIFRKFCKRHRRCGVLTSRKLSTYRLRQSVHLLFGQNTKFVNYSEFRFIFVDLCRCQLEKRGSIGEIKKNLVKRKKKSLCAGKLVFDSDVAAR